MTQDRSEELLGRIQAAMAERAFEAYNFGEGVAVAGVSGWEYYAAGHQRSREVYLENVNTDAKENPSTRLGFTVRYDPQTGVLAEAYAEDATGSVFGCMPEGHLEKLNADSAMGKVEAPTAALSVLTGIVMKTFEVTGFGFDGATDATDDRVFWVKAQSHDDVRAALAGTKGSFHDAIDAEADVDFVLPAQADLLKAGLLEFERHDLALQGNVSNCFEQTAAHISREQQEALTALQVALSQATDSGLFDELAAHAHPDRINAFCDDIREFAQVNSPLKNVPAKFGAADSADIDEGRSQGAGDLAELGPLDQGLHLRNQALALLQAAQDADGLKAFTVTHTRSFGASTCILWAAERPSEEVAQAALDEKFEPERDETILVEDCFTLQEMTGVANTSRLNDLLDRHESVDHYERPSF